MLSASLENYDETDCVFEQFRKKEWIQIAISEAVCRLNSPLLERSDALSNQLRSRDENTMR